MRCKATQNMTKKVWSPACLFGGLVVFACNPSPEKIEAEYVGF